MTKVNVTKLMLVLAMLVLGVLPLVAGGLGDAGKEIVLILAPLIVALVSPLLLRLFRKLGIEVNDGLIEPILMRLIELIAQIQKTNPDIDGASRKAKVVALSRMTLSNVEQKLLVKRYGSLETAVQAAYERSATALKNSTLSPAPAK